MSDSGNATGTQAVGIGFSIGAYVIRSLLGEGGMAQVYVAEHKSIGRKMAVKVLKAEMAAEAEWLERFTAEAQVVAALKHKNIVEVFDFGQLPDGRQYIMMEYLQGETLDVYMACHAPVKAGVALDFVAQILNALGEAHKKGIVHRDLKPGNVMLLREHNGELLLKVLDFGLARQGAGAGAVAFALRPGQQDSKASLIAGTPAYIAPEQALGQTVDGRADLYALGIVLFEMLTGRLPFKGEDDHALVNMRLSKPAPPLAAYMSHVPEALEALVASLLAKNIDERPANADEARHKVQHIARQLAASPMALQQPAPKTVRMLRPQARPPFHRRAEVRRLLALAAMVAMPLAVFGIGVGVVAYTLPGAKAVSAPAAPAVVSPAPAVVSPTPAVVPPALRTVSPAKAVVSPAKAVVSPTPAVVPPAKVVVPPAKAVVSPASRCTVSAHWRRAALAQLADLGEMASKKSVRAGVLFEGEERRVSVLVHAARTSRDCAAVETALARLQRSIQRH